MREARAAVERLPSVVTAALRDAARRTAVRIRDGARQRVPVLTGWTRDHIELTEVPDEKLFIVSAGSDRPRVGISLHTSRKTGRKHTQRVTLNMLPAWLEYGTATMSARPFMRPAVEAERSAYVTDMARASEDAARRTLG
jgi:HK97 gp10 family phage protein